MNRGTKYYILGETYIRFDFEYSEPNKSLIKRAYLEQVGLHSRDFFKAKELLRVSIAYDKGSTKTRIIILGTVVNIYMNIGNYGSFKSSIREMVNDVRLFSSYVIEHIDNDPNINKNHILNSQRRTGLPGRISELYKRVENLEHNVNNLSNIEVQSELQEIKGEIANLAEVLSHQERILFLQSFDDNYIQNIPQPDNKKTTYLYNRYALKPDDEIEIIEE